MRILFIATANNGLCQRLRIELERKNHKVGTLFGASEEDMIASVNVLRPDVIVAPYLKTPIPEEIWKNNICLIVHPGIAGDRGPSSMDWSIMERQQAWGVTILQADEEMDAGDIWSTRTFAMRKVSKSCLYRHEVTQAACEAVLEAIAKFGDHNFKPKPLDYNDKSIKGKLKRPVKRADRRIDWSTDSQSIIRKIRAADSNPGVLENQIFDEPYFMYGAHNEGIIKGRPGELLARRNGAICIGTGDGSVWISHLKRRHNGVKLKAALALGSSCDDLPESPLDPMDSYSGQETFREIWFESRGSVGVLNFDFYNGAMSTDQCIRLRKAFMRACKTDHRVIMLKSGDDIWSNGINLNTIENANNPADESWDNIVAINDLIREIINCESKLIVSAMAGNAGAGGAIFALAADYVFARSGIVLNPHYANMGLYGSEYWTYLLPRRVGQQTAEAIMTACEAIDTVQAKEMGFIDDAFGENLAQFENLVFDKARELTYRVDFDELLAQKKQNRGRDNMLKSIDTYRDEELTEMWNNFYDPDSAYHLKRFAFVHKLTEQELDPARLSIENFKYTKSSSRVYKKVGV